MGSDWQNPYLPGLVNAAFTLMLKKKKKNYPFFFFIIPLLKSFGEIETGVEGDRLASGPLKGGLGRWGKPPPEFLQGRPQCLAGSGSHYPLL